MHALDGKMAILASRCSINLRMFPYRFFHRQSLLDIKVTKVYNFSYDF